MSSTRKRLTPDERDAIIELKLNRVPVREIASKVGCQTRTVQLTWKAWLAETSAERNEQLESIREELIQRQDRIAAEARRGALRAKVADDAAAEARYLAEERAALREVARLTGADAPTKVEHSGGVDLDTSDAKARLLERLEQIAPR